MEPKPLPIDEHALIGLELCAMRERLSILALRIDNSYGKEIGNSGRKAAAAVDSFREVMNEQVERACPTSYAGKLNGVYHCTERLSALRQENDAHFIGARILGIAG
jgi:hypothetical protein